MGTERSSSAVRCEPKQRIVFVKTHKTGSSTVTTMLQRYGYKNNLNFALPTKRHVFYEFVKFQASRVFQYDLKDAKGNLVWPALGGFHILANHARYNRSEQDALIPNAFYFTIIREPASQFESAFNFYHMDKRMPKHAMTDMFQIPPKWFSTKVKHFFPFMRNGQMFDLGLDQETQDNKTVGETFEALSHEMDLVMITEYFDESLILLKEMLCWDFDDITYVSQLVRKSSARKNLSSDLMEKIYKLNHADVKLYRHFNRTLWDKIHAYGPGFQDDLETFRQINAAVNEQCLTNATMSFTRSQKLSQYALPQNASEKCRDYIRLDQRWVPMLRDYMARKSSAFMNNDLQRNRLSKNVTVGFNNIK
ncbi:galactose-3-O-sulfotransferase 4-like [Patiria miniata]|uniref:Galactosylceramide sulfotransferase-like n=1 Tax=Patiria miniata TaxID=46514 RepID=A0A913ZHP3_PATMI|nr:galactose-3-O-sulfotransferase 4-like [Patiria miniata]XP_038050914.1 galactose-3-O-sulfotransferase 4-like [Patiria miniata]